MDLISLKEILEWIGILVTFYQNFLLLFNATINKTALLNGERSRINVGRKGINQKLYVCVCILSHVKLFVTPWNIACRASLSMGLSWQEYRSGLPFSHSGDLPDPGINSVSLASPLLGGGCFTAMAPGKPKPEKARPNFLLWERNPGNETLPFISQFFRGWEVGIEVGSII